MLVFYSYLMIFYYLIILNAYYNSYFLINIQKLTNRNRAYKVHGELFHDVKETVSDRKGRIQNEYQISFTATYN